MVESGIKPILASLKSVVSNITIHGPCWVQAWPTFSLLGYLFLYLSRNAVITNNHDSSFFLFSIQTVVQCFKILSFVKTFFPKCKTVYLLHNLKNVTAYPANPLMTKFSFVINSDEYCHDFLCPLSRNLAILHMLSQLRLLKTQCWFYLCNIFHLDK